MSDTGKHFGLGVELALVDPRKSDYDIAAIRRLSIEHLPADMPPDMQTREGRQMALLAYQKLLHLLSQNLLERCLAGSVDLCESRVYQHIAEAGDEFVGVVEAFKELLQNEIDALWAITVVDPQLQGLVNVAEEAACLLHRVRPSRPAGVKEFFYQELCTGVGIMAKFVELVRTRYELQFGQRIEKTLYEQILRSRLFTRGVFVLGLHGAALEKAFVSHVSDCEKYDPSKFVLVEREGTFVLSLRADVLQSLRDDFARRSHPPKGACPAARSMVVGEGRSILEVFSGWALETVFIPHYVPKVSH